MRAQLAGIALMLAGVGHIVFALMEPQTASAAQYLWISAIALIVGGAAALGGSTAAGRVAAVALVVVGATSVWRLIGFPWGDAEAILTTGFTIHHVGILGMGVAAAMWFFGPGRAGDLTSRIGSGLAAVGVAIVGFSSLPTFPIAEIIEAIGFGLFALRPRAE